MGVALAVRKSAAERGVGNCVGQGRESSKRAHLGARVGATIADVGVDNFLVGHRPDIRALRRNGKSA